MFQISFSFRQEDAAEDWSEEELLEPGEDPPTASELEALDLNEEVATAVQLEEELPTPPPPLQKFQTSPNIPKLSQTLPMRGTTSVRISATRPFKSPT